MDKRDLTPVIIVGALLILWITIGPSIFPPRPVPPPAVEVEEPELVQVEEPLIEPEEITETPEEPVEEQPPAQLINLENDHLRMVFSTHGAALLKATFLEYRQTVGPDSDAVVADFSSMPALVYDSVPGLGENFAFQVIGQPSANRIVLERTNAQGLELRRTLELTDEYLLKITDRWTNDGETTLFLDGARLRLGPMSRLPDVQRMRGQSFMGLDTLATGAASVKFWGRGRGFETPFRGTRRDTSPPMEVVYDPDDMPSSVEWVAAKNKYFVKILHLQQEDQQDPHGGGGPVSIYLRRMPTQAEDPSSEHRAGSIVIDQVAGLVTLHPFSIEPGATLERSYSCYLGPKKFSALRELGHNKEQVMEFGARGIFSFLDGFMKFLQRSLLSLLNGIYAVFGNYGVAIILLTIFVKIIFWPITHKGMSSMRRMQELQPQMAAIKEKHKTDAKKQQEEIMKLYKEHKINPLGGCLPMLIQIPVFIALFIVLRSAIELRFARFLWVTDLSEAERLIEFGFSIPLLGWDALNVLPIIMTVTMIMQQKLTPATGDAQQRRMMATIMPLMMFYFFYTMPSGLILYWTTNQVATIIGQLFMRRWRKWHATEKQGGGSKAK